MTDTPMQNPFESPVSIPADASAFESGEDKIPWEQSGPIVGRYCRTVAGFILRPRETAQKLHTTVKPNAASNFLAIRLVIAITLDAAFWYFIGIEFTWNGKAVPFPVFTIPLAFILLFLVYVYAILLHVSVIITSGTFQSFESTSRTLAYSVGAASLWLIVPFVGVALVLQGIYIVAICLSAVHRLPIWRIILAMLLLPLLLAVLYFA